jgi:hypothetical protein
MKIFGFAGWSGSGKTTLIEKLIPLFVERKFKVSLIKHAHHTFEVDQPGKDSYRHRQAGCTEVLVSSSRRWALVHELHGAGEPGLEELIMSIACWWKASSGRSCPNSRSTGRQPVNPCCTRRTPTSSASPPTRSWRPPCRSSISTMRGASPASSSGTSVWPSGRARRRAAPGLSMGLVLRAGRGIISL